MVYTQQFSVTMNIIGLAYTKKHLAIDFEI